jgi:hypothetical protein
VGGLEGSLARTAEEFYEQLEPAQRKLARRVFVRLTALGDGTEDTRRPTRLEELQGLAGQSDGADIAGVLDRAAGARLLTLDQERVELAHEALIRCWPRLHGWLTEDRDALRILRQLTGTAHGPHRQRERRGLPRRQPHAGNRQQRQNSPAVEHLRPPSPRPSAILTGHTEEVSHAAFSSDGRTLATASWDDTARLWDTTESPERAARNVTTTRPSPIPTAC